MPFTPKSGRTLSVQTRQNTRTSIGASDPAWVNRLTGIPCDIAPLTADLANTFGRPDLIGNFAIYTNQDIAVQSTERVVIGSVEYVIDGYLPFENPMTGTRIYVTLGRKRNQ